MTGTGERRRPVVTIGNFDGVHRGHRALVERATTLAHAMNEPACVYTFDPAPRDVLRPDNGIPRIQTLDDRVARLAELGVDMIVIEPFTREFGARGAEWFATEVLASRLGASAVVVGWDFRFGRGRTGSVDSLRSWLTVPVEQVEAVHLDGAVVSSSRIREAVRAGDVASAATFLGRPHEVVGRVVPGDARGRELGFPTANVAPLTPLVPRRGVYAVQVLPGDDTVVPGVANVGSRPTFDGRDDRVEVHLLGWTGDLYGRTIRVRFVDRLRDERSFPDAHALVAQIRADVDAARAVLGA